MLFLTHREKLIKQAVDKVSMVWPEASIGVCMADRDELDTQIVVASIQSVSHPSRLKRLKECGFILCTVDEVHHAASPSYQNFLEKLGFLETTENRLLIGVTATPRKKRGGWTSEFRKIL